jgi:hypothetical protein
MISEEYRYDKPLGLYGFESKQRLGGSVVREFIRYEQMTNSDSIKEFTAENTGSVVSLVGESRLSTLVSADESIGYALAVAPSEHPHRRGMDGIFYSVDLCDPPAVVNARSVFVSSAAMLTAKRTYATVYEAEIQELTRRFKKHELEAILRIMGKLTTGLGLAARVPDEEPAHQKTISHKAISAFFRNREALKHATAIEPNVMRALQHYTLEDLSNFFPTNKHQSQNSSDAPIQDGSPQETLLILEWGELLDGAQDLLRREDDLRRPKATIAIQHTDNSHDYIMRFQAEYGVLRKVQVLCNDLSGDSWQAQEFNLQASDESEEDLEMLQVDPRWDKAKILETVRHGKPISDEFYESYLALAAKDPNTSIPEAIVIDYAQKQQIKKRRAA